jgi:hypothetical protein
VSHGSMAQDEGKHNWGPLLQPGVYQSITIDQTRSLCSEGSDPRAAYEFQDVAVTGSNPNV